MMDKSDFDELDRAVQSLVGDDSSANLSATGPVSTAPISSPVQDQATNPEPTVEQPQTVETPPVATEPREAKPMIKHRSRGRFMDIVPPRPKAANSPALRASRTGVEITPAAEAGLDAPVQNTGFENDVVQNTTVDEVGQSAEPVTTPSDNLAEAEASQPAPTGEALPAGSPSQPPAAVDTAPDASPDSANDADFDAELDQLVASIDEPQADAEAPAGHTPFIEGAQVEKRPLGTGSTAESAEAPDSTPDPVDLVEKEPTTNAATDSAKPEPDETPAELSPNVMTGARVKPAPVQTDGPASIAQQYKAEPAAQATEAAPGSSMFDATNYAQPLGSQDKKRSGWLALLWVVLLLALGGGGAFVAYQLNLF